jgi:hypothetical protein
MLDRRLIESVWRSIRKFKIQPTIKKLRVREAKSALTLAEKISSFWDWFARNADRLQPANVDEITTEELEAQLDRLGVCDWEIGPGMSRPNMFAISPGGNPSLLDTTRAIISFAPQTPDWEFHPAKPRRKWKLRFKFRDGMMVDATDWEFVVFRFDDGMHDILFKAPGNCLLSKEDKDLAGTILVQGEIGEKKMLEKVNVIEVVEEWKADDKKSARKMEVGLLDNLIK